MTRAGQRSQADLEETIAPYWRRSREPLQILVFLLPLVAIYELGLIFASAQPRLLAYRQVEEVFEAMGLASAGSALPAILVVVALLALQVLSRRSWRVHWPTTLVMAAESVALAVPLMLFASVLMGGGVAPPAQLGETESAGLGSRLLSSIGAGLYEEFLFRWILIATLHAILADGMRVADRTATGIAVGVSSLLFMLAHQPADASHALFYLGSGVFFSAVYVVREFGVAAGSHAAYDVLVEILGASG